MEEIDLCWRAHNKGFSTKYVGNSTIFHVGGATLNTSNPKKTYFNFRNSLYTLTKNAKGTILFLILLRLILDGIAGIHFLAQRKPKHTWAVIKAHGGFYTKLPKLLKFRRANTQRKTYSKVNSIVWNYFVLKISKYSKLNNH
jgi:GT2 family glycosyltransferase